MISWLKFIEKTLVSILQTKRVASLLSYRVARLRGCFASEFEFSISRALGLPPVSASSIASFSFTLTFSGSYAVRY